MKMNLDTLTFESRREVEWLEDVIKAALNGRVPELSEAQKEALDELGGQLEALWYSW